VDRRDECIAVAEVVLAELARGVTLRLEEVRDRRVLVGESLGSAREADLEQAGADRGLPVMNAARPAVQLCCAYASVKMAPSFAMRSMLGVR
jgi:hypothetical protein